MEQNKILQSRMFKKIFKIFKIKTNTKFQLNLTELLEDEKPKYTTQALSQEV